MHKVDMDALQRQVADMWRASKNPDDDPIIAGQIRAADLNGHIAVFMTAEQQSSSVPPSILLQITAAITANMVLGYLQGVAPPPGISEEEKNHELLHEFLGMTSYYLHDMIGGEFHNGSTIDGGSVEMPLKDVGDA